MRPIVLWSYVGVATHPALDWLNNYGMRWWLPLDGSWSYGDAVFIIDPWLWIGLGGAVFLAAGPRGWGRWAWGLLAVLATALVLSAELEPGVVPEALWLAGLATVLAARAVGLGGAAFPRAALVATSVYVGALVLADGAEEARVAAAAREAGLEPREVLVAPEPADPFRSTVEIRTDSAFVPGDFHWLRTPRVHLRPAEAVPLLSAPPELTPAQREVIVAEARRVPEARWWLTWSRLPYVHVEPDGSGWRVRFTDARYDGQRVSGGLAGVEVLVPSP